MSKQVLTSCILEDAYVHLLFSLYFLVKINSTVFELSTFISIFFKINKKVIIIWFLTSTFVFPNVIFIFVDSFEL